jgi:hypothetical protein
MKAETKAVKLGDSWSENTVNDFGSTKTVELTHRQLLDKFW